MYWEMKNGQTRCDHASSTGNAHTSNTYTAQDTIDCDVIYLLLRDATTIVKLTFEVQVSQNKV